MKAFALLGLLAVSATAETSREAVFRNASAALSSGDLSAAERGFQALLAQTPNDVAVLGNLGVVYSRLGRQVDAVSVYRKALRSHPDDPGILLNLGLVYFKENDFQQAYPFFEQLGKRSPANLQVARLLSACELNAGRAELAVPRLERIRATAPDDEGALFLLAVAYNKLKQPEKSKQVLAELLRSADPAKTDFLLGRAFYGAALFDEAAASFQKVLRADSRFPAAHRELAKVLVSQRKTDEALRELHAALEQDPQDGEAVYFLGAVLAQEGRTSEAIPYLLQSTQTQPASWAAFYYLGKATLQEGKAKEAVAILRQAVQLNPNDASAYYLLSRALQADGQSMESKTALARVQALKAGALRTEIDAVSGAKVIGAR